MGHWIRQNRGFLVFMMLLGLFRTAVADWNPVPSGSMHPNILEGDVRLIKRIVALPGDRVAMRDKQLIINGELASYRATQAQALPTALDAPWQVELRVEQLGGAGRLIQWLPGVTARDNFAVQVIPEGQYLMLGDNRDNSADSRYIGLVPRQLLIGKAVRVLVSVDILGICLPRLERFGQALV